MRMDGDAVAARRAGWAYAWMGVGELAAVLDRWQDEDLRGCMAEGWLCAPIEFEDDDW